jgi:hypothetical protein
LRFLGLSQKEYKTIAEESDKLLKNLSEKEINENQKELLNSLSPDLISFFRNNYSNSQIAIENPSENCLENKGRKEKSFLGENYDKFIDESEEKKEHFDSFIFNLIFDDQGEVIETNEKNNENENKEQAKYHNFKEIFNFIALPPKYSTLIAYGINKLLNIFKKLQKRNKNSNEFLDCMLIIESKPKILRRKLTNFFLNENFDLFYLASQFITIKITTLNVLAIKIFALFLNLRFSRQIKVNSI